jgi:hypothetical protein
MATNLLEELENSNATPLDQIYSKEFIEGVLKAGSLISMLENKKINTTLLLSLLLENSDYQEFFTEITSSENFKDAILSLLYLHPSLVKSKITKSVVRKLNARRTNHGARKTAIQQTPSGIKKSKKQTI